MKYFILHCYTELARCHRSQFGFSPQMALFIVLSLFGVVDSSASPYDAVEAAIETAKVHEAESSDVLWVIRIVVASMIGGAVYLFLERLYFHKNELGVSSTPEGDDSPRLTRSLVVRRALQIGIPLIVATATLTYFITSSSPNESAGSNVEPVDKVIDALPPGTVWSNEDGSSIMRINLQDPQAARFFHLLDTGDGPRREEWEIIDLSQSVYNPNCYAGAAKCVDHHGVIADMFVTRNTDNSLHIFMKFAKPDAVPIDEVLRRQDL